MNAGDFLAFTSYPVRCSHLLVAASIASNDKRCMASMYVSSA